MTEDREKKHHEYASNNPRTWEDFERKNYEEAGNNPKEWEVQANDLLFSADVLRERRFEALKEFSDSIKPFASSNLIMKPELTIMGIEIMLRGFAVECLLKASWLKNGNKIIENGKFITEKPRCFTNHNYEELAEYLGFKFNEVQRIFLRILSHFSKDLGRYPITREFKFGSAYSQNVLDNIEPPFKHFTALSDYEYLDGIIKDIIK